MFWVKVYGTWEWRNIEDKFEWRTTTQTWSQFEEIQERNKSFGVEDHIYSGSSTKLPLSLIDEKYNHIWTTKIPKLEKGKVGTRVQKAPSLIRNYYIWSIKGPNHTKAHYKGCTV